MIVTMDLIAPNAADLAAILTGEPLDLPYAVLAQLAEARAVLREQRANPDYSTRLATGPLGDRERRSLEGAARQYRYAANQMRAAHEAANSSEDPNALAAARNPGSHVQTMQDLFVVTAYSAQLYLHQATAYDLAYDEAAQSRYAEETA